MHEKSLILIDGPPGSGSTRLSRSTAETLRKEGLSIEHISTGDRLRAIGRGMLDSAYREDVIDHFYNSGATVPLDEEIMFGVIDEALEQMKHAQIIELDGYPRYEPQVDNIGQLADIHDRDIKGMLFTIADWQTSLDRMIKRGQKKPERAITQEEAINRLAFFNTSFPLVVNRLMIDGIPIRQIETDGSKSTTDRLALQAMRGFFSR